MGVGNFAGMMPPDVAALTSLRRPRTRPHDGAYRKIVISEVGRAPGRLHPAPLPENTFDLVIGNPPFADVVIKADPKYAKQNLLSARLFLRQVARRVRPGGVLMFISSAGTMNKIGPEAREYLADRADLVGAIRLPGNAFAENAGTEVTTDIVILRKRLPDEKAGDRTWTETVPVKLPGPGGNVKACMNRYFAEHPGDGAGRAGLLRQALPGPLRGARAARAPTSRPSWRRRSTRSRKRDVGMERPRREFDTDFGTTEKKEGTFYIGPKTASCCKAPAVSACRWRARQGRRRVARPPPTSSASRQLVPVRDAISAPSTTPT
jgi:hypothetical protein